MSLIHILLCIEVFVMQSVSRDVAKKFNAMRAVSVTMHYAVHDHDDLISPNTLTFPTITDSIDKKTCEGLRELWLHAVKADKEAAKVQLNEPQPETEQSSMERAFSFMAQALHGQIMERFVRSAVYPVPGAYMVLLPVRSNMRTDIISNLVPFERTREMLLRLEDKLESPMRVLQIGHMPVNDVDALRASGTIIMQAGKLIYN